MLSDHQAKQLKCRSCFDVKLLFVSKIALLFVSHSGGGGEFYLYLQMKKKLTLKLIFLVFVVVFFVCFQIDLMIRTSCTSGINQNMVKPRNVLLGKQIFMASLPSNFL